MRLPIPLFQARTERTVPTRVPAGATPYTKCGFPTLSLLTKSIPCAMFCNRLLCTWQLGRAPSVEFLKCGVGQGDGAAQRILSI